MAEPQEEDSGQDQCELPKSFYQSSSIQAKCEHRKNSQADVEMLCRSHSRGGSAHPSGGPTPNLGRSPPASDRDNTVRVRKLQSSGPAIIPGDLLTAMKNQGVYSLCLQRQSTGDCCSRGEKKETGIPFLSTTKTWPTGSMIRTERSRS